MKKSPPTALVDFLKSYQPAVRELTLAVRAFVVGLIPPMTELVVEASDSVSIAYTPSGKFKQAICHIVTSAGRVDLCFHRGAEMPDPAGLLQGTGKSLRHVTIERPVDLDRVALRSLLAAAASHVHHTGTHHGVIIKSASGPKRWPRPVVGKFGAEAGAD